MKKKVKVMMLPTEDIVETRPCYYTDGISKHTSQHIAGKTTLSIIRSMNGMQIPNSQHLYVTISQDVEPIKKGDWRMITDKESSLYGQFEQKKGNLPENDQWSKIIATTDNNLFSEDDIIPYTSLPRVQQSFLKEYVANSDGEYEVDYYNVMPQSNGTRTDGKIIDEIALDNSLNTLQVLKLNQDNTVNITSVEEKTYTLEQI
tara:strand:- start:37 stop:645 length:609 start_codon:yes stop_codon:yes gene_type:complete